MAEPSPPFPGSGSRSGPGGIVATVPNTDSLLAPMLVLGLAVALAVFAGILRAISFNIGFGVDRMQFYLAFVGWPTAFLVGLTAGIAAVFSPISARVSAGLTVLGGGVIVLALLASLSFVVASGLGELPRTLAEALISGRTAAMLVGASALLVARRARSADPMPPGPVVIALVVSAGLVAGEGVLQAVFGRLDFLDAADRIVVALASFGLGPGLLLLAAALVLLLQADRSELRLLVMVAALITAGIGLLAQLVVAVIEADTFARGEAAAAGGAVPAVVLVAFVIASLSNRWSRSAT